MSWLECCGMSGKVTRWNAVHICGLQLPPTAMQQGSPAGLRPDSLAAIMLTTPMPAEPAPSTTKRWSASAAGAEGQAGSR